MRGDPSLFAREDSVEAAWRVVDPVLSADAPLVYEPGTWGPPEAAGIIAGDGGWHNPRCGRPDDSTSGVLRAVNRIRFFMFLSRPDDFASRRRHFLSRYSRKAHHPMRPVRGVQRRKEAEHGKPGKVNSIRP